MLDGFRTTWRRVAHLFPLAGLEALRAALVDDDARLVQSTTVLPSLALTDDASLPVEAACLIGYCGWHGAGLSTVGEVEEYFRATCAAIDAELGEPGGCRHLINPYDETPRDEMRRELLVEVNRELARRAAGEVSA